MWKETVEAYFEVLTLYFPGETRQIHEHSLQAEIWTQDFLNVMQEWHLLDR
jgi:hypothetical protein